MLMLRCFLILAGMTAALAYQTALAVEPTYKPPQGFVPNEKVTIAIAVAIWGPIYGAAQVAQEKPYHAKLVNGA